MTQQDFVKGASNWDNHRHFLWRALECTSESGLPVLELGVGDGSTPFLRQYCNDSGRLLLSYDSNKEWALKFNAMLTDFTINREIWQPEYSVVLVDHAPGEHRKKAIQLLDAQVIIIHDSEPKGWTAADYQVRELFPRFKYVADYKDGGAWTSALSNTIDVTGWETLTDSYVFKSQPAKWAL